MRCVAAILVMLMIVSVLGCQEKAEEQPVVEEMVDGDEPLDDKAEGKKERDRMWLTSFEEATSLAQKLNLPVLINFSGSDWCIWCIRLMEEVFDTKEFKAYARKNFVLLNLDFPRESTQSEEEQAANRALVERFEIEGFPTIILLNSKGELIGRTGYREGGPKPYIDHLKEMIK